MDRIGSQVEDPAWYRQVVLLRANHFQFSSGDDYWVRSIGSRMLFWVIAGRGSAEVRGTKLDLSPGDAVLFPWMTDVRYRADRSEPFLTGAAHLLPWHDRGLPVVPWAGHGPRDPLHRLAGRQNRPWPGLETTHRLSPVTARQATRLGEAAVEYFTDDEPEDAVLRSFGVLIARVLFREDSRAEVTETPPPGTAVMMEYVRSHIADPLSTTTLARVAGCSVSTAERRFRRHTGLSPTAWIRRERLLFAADILRTSKRPINDVARGVGFTDPLHFSREFRRQFRYPPSDARARTPLI
ncbi:helix-turn-helix domain-containing protein [Actinoplanes sp. LDG1-06]|uniref:Helix-turn-helix domain-containing protein n=1 Tax=Paractinoplanes ovalisporus TaxID=2810368 RepID=A0ABS2AFI8_9ACTN|nr:helix-turn-helix domain-containing protein [Actinoplanes ovalisporus]MBM2618584.1 helix-turn-helix domain-containing protein [Actinoplanes ovalisporus]